METMDIILIVLACVAVAAGLLFFAKRKKPGPVPRPGTTVTVKSTPAAKPAVSGKPAAKPTVSAAKPGTVASKPAAGARPQTPQKAPEQQTVVLFSAVPVRNVRKCLSCDGENAPDTKLCCICGRRL